MKAVIRQIGNSKGLIIPASFIAELDLQGEVEMSLVNRSIIISPAQKTRREGWFDDYCPEDDMDAWRGFVALPSEEDDWEW
jgi:antitoxin MazE